MKNAIVLCCLLFGTLVSNAQSYNPYVNQGIISPAPLLPKEFNGFGQVSFNIGNTGSSDLTYDHKYPDNAMTLVITLSDGVPSKKNPIASLGGTWVSYFDWTYDEAINTYMAVQKRTIPGDSQGTITIEYSVNKNSHLTVASNGFNINIQPPPYANGVNTTQDDAVSSYSFTRAYDYGDAPASYGTARHEIDLIKDYETGLYGKYIVLGSTVDPEFTAFSSANANGDDKDVSNDDDGVTFPELKAGTTVSIPVKVTAHDVSYGMLNAWFDWNGDGDFLDAGERVTPTPLSVFASGTYNLTVNIPETAITSVPTFTRFRIGANGGPTASNSWGEAEDYQVTIKSADLTLATTQVNVQNYGENTGSIDLTVKGGKSPYKYQWTNGAKTEDLSNLVAGEYKVIVKDANNTMASATVTITQPDAPANVAKLETKGLHLDGKRIGFDVALNWETLTENNTEFFVVERSTDGSDFVPISDKIMAAGNSETVSRYDYVDKLVTNEIVIYRVRLLEKKEVEHLSNNIVQKMEDRSVFNMIVYPNPVKDIYSVKIASDGSYRLELFDLLGKLIYTDTMNVTSGSNETKQISVENIAIGNHYLRATEVNNGKTQTVKVLVEGAK